MNWWVWEQTSSPQNLSMILLWYSHRTQQMKIIQNPEVDFQFPANLDTGLQYVVANPQAGVATNSTVGDGTSSLPCRRKDVEIHGIHGIHGSQKLKQPKYSIWSYQIYQYLSIPFQHLAGSHASFVNLPVEWCLKLKAQATGPRKLAGLLFHLFKFDVVEATLPAVARLLLSVYWTLKEQHTVGPIPTQPGQIN